LEKQGGFLVCFFIITVTPLYVYDGAKIKDQYHALKKCFPENFEIFYSLKANPLLGIGQPPTIPEPPRAGGSHPMERGNPSLAGERKIPGFFKRTKRVVICLTDLLLILEHLQELRHQSGIELGPGAPDQLLDCLRLRHRLPVRAITDHGVIGIGNG
jgi:hypothetical protein